MVLFCAFSCCLLFYQPTAVAKKRSGAIPWSQPPVVRNSHAIFWLLAPSDWPTSPARIEDTRMHHLMIVCCNSWFLLLRVLWKLISSDPGGFVLRVFLLFVVLPTNCCSKKKKWCNSYILSEYPPKSANHFGRPTILVDVEPPRRPTIRLSVSVVLICGEILPSAVFTGPNQWLG